MTEASERAIARRTGGGQQRGAVDPGLKGNAFVALMASLMALNALGIDSMLSALPEIGRAVGVASENQRQWIIVTFMLGFGSAQIVWGPLADRYGRKPILVATLVLYAVLSVVAGLATTFPLLLMARLLQGIASSASRVLVVSIVRDCYSGRKMARVMSLTFTIFLLVPVLAPSIGQIITTMLGSWRYIFYFLGLYGALVSLIAATRLRETLHVDYRRPLSFASVTGAMTRVVTGRATIGYTLAMAATFGCMAGFITSVQQIFADIFLAPKLFPAVFAGVAGSMAVASFVNARLVERLGTRRISHMALLCFLAASGVHLALALAGYETIVSFALLMAVQMFFWGFIGANFSTMAMEPVGDIAGSAASVQGFLTTCIGALLGSVIGQSFDGTTVPLTLGYVLLGVLALSIVLFTEGGRLFRPQHAHT